MHYIFGRPFRAFLTVFPLTPHSASLHVGLKSVVSLGLFWDILKTQFLDFPNVGTP
ncbi:hypothetical protein Barb6_02086 [Bacteroidales bacterium Barb6]|nr:hypothetical protein Barb6_02086 [Bacteroidales bacterium Barb6]